MDCAVVLAEREIDKERIGEVAAILVEHLDLLPFDAKAAVGRARGGILVGKTSREAALEIARQVSDLGIQAGAAPLSAADGFGRRWPVLRGGCAKAGLYADPGHQGMQRYEWNSLQAASLVRYHEPKAESGGTGAFGRMGRFLVGAGYMAGGIGGLAVALPTAKELLSARSRIEGTDAAVSSTDTYLLDLYLHDPDVTLRVDARKFHYGYLKERMGKRFELNFHMLLGHLAEGAPDARFSPLTKAYMDGDLLDKSTVSDLTEFELYSRWFLLASEAFPRDRGS